MGNKPTLAQKGRYGLQYRGVECTNCGHPLDVSDKYCPNCSQANSTKKLTLKDFVDEFFSSLISYDSKLLKTLSALLTKPGKITRDYIQGKRVSYTNPFRFLLSLSIIYFLLLNFNGDFSKMDNEFGLGQKGSIFRNDGSFSLSVESAEDSVKNRETIGLYKTIDSLNVLESIKKSDSIALSNPVEHFSKLENRPFLGRVFGKREFFNSLLRAEDIYSFDEIPKTFEIENTRENRVAFNSAVSLSKFLKEPGSFLSSVISRLPFAIFLFLPVFAFFIWLVYIRKKYTYTEHLIFSFHNQSLFFILLIISFLVDSVFTIYSSWFFFLIFALYLFLAMRKFYQQGFFKTSVKYIFLNTIFFILAVFAIVILFMGSAFTY